MKVKSIRLINWRNFLDKKIDFNSTIVLLGKNGQGKTNILESIYFLATTKSFRTINNRELINWNEDFCRVEGEIEGENNNNFKIELIINKNPQRKFQKKAKINGAPQKLIDVLGTLKVVLFSPEMIDLISGSPALRRRYLDSVLAITNHKYAKNLLVFAQVLKRRNKLLSMIQQGRAKESELDFWDEELIRAGCYIILRRAQLIKFYNQYLPKAYGDIGGEAKEHLRLKYLNGLIKENQKITSDELAKKYRYALAEKRNREIEFETTLVGPQRDEIIFVLSDKKLQTFGSRGEYRSVILAIKLTEIEYLKKIAQGEKPVLLLDDVFSELDEMRRHKLAEVLKNIQAIITTTDLSHLEPSLQKKAKIITLGESKNV